MTTSTARIQFPGPDTTVVTDAGLETWLMFDCGIDLPSFAAYPLTGTEHGRARLKEYYERFVAIAAANGTALVLDAPTWRANPDWAETLGHDRDRLEQLIGASVDVVREVRDASAGDRPFLIGGAVGPRGDGYRVDTTMEATEAELYHSTQIDAFTETPVDVVTAMTLGYSDEAIGIARAAERAGLPVVIAYTVETDGRLPSGMTLADAVDATDRATDGYPVHYMVNCAHPTHLAPVLTPQTPWLSRIGGIRANASTLSHAELDEALELDRGDPADLAARYLELQDLLPNLHVFGGCCGTDHNHVAAIAEAVCGL